MSVGRRIDPPDVSDTRRYGFSQAVLVDRRRRLLLSGQVAVDADGRTVGATLAAQTEQVVDNIDRVLRAGGATLEDVVMLRIHVVASAADDLSPISDVLRSTFGEQPPASTWIVVCALADPAWLIEVEAEAAVP